jgi:hypothetical protein
MEQVCVQMQSDAPAVAARVQHVMPLPGVTDCVNLDFMHHVAPLCPRLGQQSCPDTPAAIQYSSGYVHCCNPVVDVAATAGLLTTFADWSCTLPANIARVDSVCIAVGTSRMTKFITQGGSSNNIRVNYAAQPR